MNFQHHVPPDDAQYRRDAKERADRDLEDIEARGPRIDRVAESLQQHIRENHFAERLRTAFGGN